MSALDDDCWLMVFEHLSLNERTNVRLTCKRFRYLCDLIKIFKLVIFERIPPLPGRLPYTGEPYGLESTAYVVNLDRFFNDEQIAFKQMKPIKKLVVYGDLNYEVDLKVKFERLTTLELHHCRFLSPIILCSTKIEHMVFNSVNLRPVKQIRAKAKAIREQNSDELLQYYALGLEEFKGMNLKYLRIYNQMDPMLPSKFIGSGRFDSLEVADLCLPNWACLVILARKGYCPALRTLNVMIETNEIQSTVENIDELDLGELFDFFSPNLAVYLFGLPFSSPQHKPAFVNFLKPLGQKIKVCGGRFSIQLDQAMCTHIKKWARKCDLSQFFKMVTAITMSGGDQQEFNGKLMKRFLKCNKIMFAANPRPAIFECFLDVLANLKGILLHCEIGEEPRYGNKLLNAIGEKCQQLNVLWFESWEKIDFSFLFKLPCLRQLTMLLAYTFPQKTLIELLKKSRDLAKLDVCFVRSNSESKAVLSSFKQLVNETFADRFLARKLGFHVEIHTKIDQYVRCVLKEHDEPIEQMKEDQSTMFAFLEYMKARLVFDYVVANKKSAAEKVSMMDKKKFDKLFD